MTKISLDWDLLEEDEFKLIGLVSVLEDYRLAYFLNKNLGWSLVKSKFDLDFRNRAEQGNYPVFEFDQDSIGLEIKLINNKYSGVISKSETEVYGLFDQIEHTTYLIPEKKNIDYLIKLSGEINDHTLEKIIETIKNIPQVQTSYNLEVKDIKSKEFLIF
jgi:hypothetical protein